jgi:hypothetical protein
MEWRVFLLECERFNVEWAVFCLECEGFYDDKSFLRDLLFYTILKRIVFILDIPLKHDTIILIVDYVVTASKMYFDPQLSLDLLFAQAIRQICIRSLSCQVSNSLKFVVFTLHYYCFSGSDISLDFSIQGAGVALSIEGELYGY